MRWLVLGAGNIGCLYAARLAQVSEDVAILARGARAEQIRQTGIAIEDATTSERLVSSVRVVTELADPFDIVLVALPKPAIAQVLPALAAHGAPTVMFFGNNAAGPKALTEALGAERVVLGFPGAGAVPDNGVIRYVITSAREQPTTLGEVDGTRSQRVVDIASSLNEASFPTAISTAMDAWLKTHAAEILPTVGALYSAGSLHQLVHNPAIQRRMVRAIREGYEVLRAGGIQITPRSHRLFDWLPERLLMLAMRRRLADPTAAIKVGHAEQARAEMEVLASEFRVLIESSGVSTPNFDRLLPPDQRPRTSTRDGSREHDLRPAGENR